jgi:hypothetical protein
MSSAPAGILEKAFGYQGDTPHASAVLERDRVHGGAVAGWSPPFFCFVRRTGINAVPPACSPDERVYSSRTNVRSMLT